MAKGSPTSDMPMELRNSKVLPSRAVMLQVFNPAPVRMTTESRSFSAQYHAATQRVPLPEISASEPSAFSSRTRRSASVAGNIHSTPSAPTPLCRSQMRRLNKWMIRKSLPQAVAFTKGTLAISVALGDRGVRHSHDLGKVHYCLSERLLLGAKCLDCEPNPAMVVGCLVYVNRLHGQAGLFQNVIEFGDYWIGALAGRADHVVGNGDRLEIEARLYFPQKQQANDHQNGRENCGLKETATGRHAYSGGNENSRCRSQP